MRRYEKSERGNCEGKTSDSEVLHDLNGATVFSKIDLKWGFHQVEQEEDSRDITTFVTHRGLYRYRR